MARRIITSIDVGSSKVTTVIAAVEENEKRPTVIGVCSHPSIGIKRGVIVNIEEATNSISESVTAAERMAGVTVSDVYVTINGEQITSINNKGVVAVAAGNEITMDDTMRAIENARTLTLPQNINPIHIIPREFVVDSQGGIKYPLGMTGMRLEVETHIITAPMSSWQNLVKCAQHFGLTVNDIVFTGWASSLAVLTDTEKDLGVSMMDIGAGTTSITIFSEGSIMYSGCIPLGGLSVTSDIAIGLQVSLEDAEKIKLNMAKIFEDRLLENNGTAASRKTPSLLLKKETETEKKKKDEDMIDVSSLGVTTKPEISKKMLKQIVEARLEEIFEMAKNTVSKAGFDLAMPAGIVFTGGSATLKDITKVAQGFFGVPCRVGYPSGLTGMTEEIASPAYAAVQGLVKHAVDDDVDLASQSKRGGQSKSTNPLTGILSWFKSLLP
jgi:cell division protein FtsA